jgi:hypothetical protein
MLFGARVIARVITVFMRSMHVAIASIHADHNRSASAAKNEHRLYGIFKGEELGCCNLISFTYLSLIAP